jgi:hypothetical protein
MGRGSYVQAFMASDTNERMDHKTPKEASILAVLLEMTSFTTSEGRKPPSR